MSFEPHQMLFGVLLDSESNGSIYT